MGLLEDDRAEYRKHSMKQIHKVFMDELEGNRIAEQKVKNNGNLPVSPVLVQWWVVNGSIVVVTLYNDGGWDYYLPGRISKVDLIAHDIRNYLLTT